MLLIRPLATDALGAYPRTSDAREPSPPLTPVTPVTPGHTDPPGEAEPLPEIIKGKQGLEIRDWRRGASGASNINPAQPLNDHVIPILRESSGNTGVTSRTVAAPANDHAVLLSSDVYPKALPGRYQLHKDPERDQACIEFGRGAWSVVYEASYWQEGKGSVPIVVAVKAPLKTTLEDAKPVLRKEARILSYLHSQRGGSAQRYVVPFLGFDAASSALVCRALPLTLGAFSAEETRAHAGAVATKSMVNPVVGSAQWLHFARHLAHGLAFLHSHGIVHGDVKPANVLLQPSTDAVGAPRWDPVFCDFSSSRVEECGSEVVEEISAVSTAYTAPELLEAFHGRARDSSKQAIATRAADVFALAATLLVPATGQELYAAPGLSSMQTLMYARAGRPLDFARQTEQGCARVKKGGLVDRVLTGPSEHDVSTRWTVGQWQAMVDAEVTAFLATQVA